MQSGSRPPSQARSQEARYGPRYEVGGRDPETRYPVGCCPKPLLVLIKGHHIT